jgi:hypothetical protein
MSSLLVAIHFLFVLFVVLGGLLVLRWPRLAYLHIPAALWGIWIEFSGRICPLTPLEQKLRAAAGHEAYSGGFIEHYLLQALYPSGLSRNLQFALGAMVLVLNLSVYIFLLRRGTKQRI